jgi:hypothetical protein
MITMAGFTQAGSVSHCGPGMRNSPKNWLMAPMFPFSSSRNTDAVATTGVILGR